MQLGQCQLPVNLIRDQDSAPLPPRSKSVLAKRALSNSVWPVRIHSVVLSCVGHFHLSKPCLFMCPAQLCGPNPEVTEARSCAVARARSQAWLFPLGWLFTEQPFSPFLMLRPFNSVPRVVMTHPPTTKLFHHSKFSTVIS